MSNSSNEKAVPQKRSFVLDYEIFTVAQYAERNTLLFPLITNEINGTDGTKDGKNFRIISDLSTGRQVMLVWLADSTSPHDQFSEVIWFANFTDHDFSALSEACNDASLTVEDAIEVSDAIANMNRI